MGELSTALEQLALKWRDKIHQNKKEERKSKEELAEHPGRMPRIVYLNREHTHSTPISLAKNNFERSLEKTQNSLSNLIACCLYAC